jgi:predicted CXXCH cytochrome family protein
VPLPDVKEGVPGMPGSVQQLTEARAKAVALVLREYGVSDQGRFTIAGMGNALPKATGTGREMQALNERVEIIVTPTAIPSRSSLVLPVVADRERIVLDLSYARGPAVGNLRVIDRLPGGTRFVKGSAVVGGRAKDPQSRGDELVWQLGDPGTNIHESITYVVRKERENTVLVPTALRLQFTAGKEERTRDFDPLRPEPHDRSVQDICARCHADIMSRPFKHGPAAAGYCTLCHDPHASDHPAWTRDQDWQLCTTCHAEKRTDVHMISGFVRGGSHPTEKAPDPSRPGKRLSCVSCHSPHSSLTKDLLGFEVRSKYEMCGYCHRGK